MIWTPRNVMLVASDPVSDTTWVTAAREIVPTDEEWYLRVQAICAQVSPS
jgi:hypothetical protein